MKRVIVLTTLLLYTAAGFAQNKERNIHHFEFELFGGIISYGNYAIGAEARYNFDSPWDVGINGSTNYNSSMLSVVGDYNFSRSNIAALFVGLGAGYAYSDILDERPANNWWNGMGVDRSSGEMSNLFYLYPRIGLELCEHIRLTITTNIYDFKKSDFMVSLGVAFGGGNRK